MSRAATLTIEAYRSKEKLWDLLREKIGTVTWTRLDGKDMCNNCKIVLPKVGLELGNPTVTFIDDAGRRLTMRDGIWLP